MSNELYPRTNEKLEGLREITKLNLIDLIKLTKIKRDAEKNKVDSSKVDDLEYSLRINHLLLDVQEAWETYHRIEHDNFGAYDFANAVLDNHIKQKVKSKK